MKKKTQAQIIEAALTKRKTGLTDEELAERTGISFAKTIRAKMENVIAIGTRKNSRGRTVKTFGLKAA